MKKVMRKPSDWPDPKNWLNEMKRSGGEKTSSAPKKSTEAAAFATPPAGSAVDIDQLREAFGGSDTVDVKSYEGSLETLDIHERNRTPSPEMCFLREAEAGRKEIDGYQVLRLLGVGGNNAVYKVVKDGKSYILKVPLYIGNYFKEKMRTERSLLFGIHEEITDRLKSGKLVNRPNIIGMHDFRDDDLTYIVLELLESEIETDKKTKETGKKVSFLDSAFEQIQGNPVRIAMFLWDVLHALEFMHSLNIVHRDVKPENCMTTHRGNRIAAVLYDFSEGLFLDDETAVRNTKLSMTPPYTSRQFIKVLYGEYINRKKDFFKECPMPRMTSVLKAHDYAGTAFATAHLLTNVLPYTYLSWGTKEELVMPVQKYDPKNPEQKPKSGPIRIRSRAVQVETNALEEVANRATETNPATPADYATAICNFQGDPLPRGQIRKVAMGKMFLNVIDRLLDPTIVTSGLRQVYEMLVKEANQPGLFTPYTPKDVELLKSAYRR